eukprot:13719-Heterococcus_DN1.PRE.1
MKRYSGTMLLHTAAVDAALDTCAIASPCSSRALISKATASEFVQIVACYWLFNSDSKLLQRCAMIAQTALQWRLQ